MSKGLIYFALKNPRIAGVRDIWLCLGVLCLKSQIPSTKLQINSKSQAPNYKWFDMLTTLSIVEG